MQVDVNKTFPMPASADAAWVLLQDIETVAACMPGGEVTEKVDDQTYKGQVKVKLGPVTAAFKGEIDVQGVDDDRRELVLVAAGKDSKGTTSASMNLTASVRAVDEQNSELIGDAAVVVNGKLVSLGGRMMGQVADQVLVQFADNFAARLPEPVADTAPAADEPAPAAAPTPPPQSSELGGFKFAWSVLVGFVKSLFSRG